MAWFDWLILIVPVCLVMWAGLRTRRYVRGAADFLAAGRLCGRYVLSMGYAANAIGVITLVTFLEIHYKTGFSVGFWSSVLAPLGILMSLTGYCTYRFRQTRAMSLGQFLEMRYSRSVRICAAVMRSVAEMVANMIMPAIAARFFIQLLALPQTFHVLGFPVSTYVALMLLFMSLSVALICGGGLLSLIVADTIQMTILYPLIACFVVFILWKFSVTREIMPVMADRVVGESFINPFDISRMRDFNLFTTIIVPAWWMVMRRANWFGNGYTTAAKTPHEQKMSDVLGSWRNASTAMFFLLLACALITFLNHADFADDALEVRRSLATQAAADVLKDAPEARAAVEAAIAASEPQVHRIGIDPPLSQETNPDTAFLTPIHEALLAEARASSGGSGAQPSSESRGSVAQPLSLPGVDGTTIDAEGLANDRFQQIRTLFYQQNLSATMRHILPPGLFGLFALLLFLAMLSTDDTRIYSPTLTVIQDVVMPLRKRPFTPEGHLLAIRLMAVAVGAFFFLGSCWMKQLDYYQMFNALAVAVWNGAGSPIMILGLYSRFGTAAGAWASLVSSTVISVAYIFVQRNWADVVYPAIAKAGLVETFDRALRALSSPFAPWIEWKMDAVKCPVNTIEYVFFLEVFTLLAYVVVSKLTCRKPFDLDRMLHREPSSEMKGAPAAQMMGAAQIMDRAPREMEGASQMEGRASRKMVGAACAADSFGGKAATLHCGEAAPSLPAGRAPSLPPKAARHSLFRRVAARLVGITPEYTRGDRIIAWSVFFYSFVFSFGLCFLAVVVWNGFHRWPVAWWSRYFVAINIVVPGIVAAISTVWFGVGGIIGLRQLFRDLAARKEIDITDDGRVENGVSADD